MAEARAKRKGVAVHAEGPEGIRNALAADIHSLEHGWFLDEKCVDHMIKHGIWWVPTSLAVVVAFAAYSDELAKGLRRLIKAVTPGLPDLVPRRYADKYESA